MSEVQSRPARGRSSGRGGYGSRGPRPNKQSNGASDAIDTSADQGELGELKRRYTQQLSTLKELFPDWTDVDLLLAIEESDGDLQATIEKISEGNVSQFSEVKKTKDRSRSKVKGPNATGEAAPAARGSHGERERRGGDSVRGRGRGTDRGRGGFRGARGGATTNGTRSNGGPSIPTTESSAWDSPAAAAEPQENGHDAAQPSEQEAPKSAAAGAAAPAKTWASMFAKPKPVPALPKSLSQSSAAHEDAPLPPAEVPAHEVAQDQTVEAQDLPIPPPVADEALEEPQLTAEDTSVLTPEATPEASAPELEITPSKDELTKDNVEHLPDESNPPLTETVASTVASSRDIGVATPLPTASQLSIGRPGLGGFATSALKATSGSHRSASYQRRIAEQQEAVVMPGNHAVDRAAVQFGRFGLEDPDADSLDVDEDREEAETRTQPPQHSPVAQPRASLPPAPRQPPPTAEIQHQEAIPTPKQAPGLPPVPQHQPQMSQQSPPAPLGAQTIPGHGSQGTQPYNQFGGYGRSGAQTEASAPPQRPYDAFGHQTPQTSYHDFNQTQAQQQPQSQASGFSSAPEGFPPHYPTSEQQRSAYNDYYQQQQQYAQQNAQSQQQAGSAQQRTGSAFGAGPNDSTFPSSQQQQNQSRYDAQNSGQNTPNPTMGGQLPAGPASQGQHMQQPHGQPGHSGNYTYNHPYYGSPYYANYMNQFGGNYGSRGGYGGFGGKSMYGQPQQHYGMSPQASYDQQHSSSPANGGGFGGQSSMHSRESGLGGGLGEYGRSVSGGASQNPQHGNAGGAGFGGISDVFGRSQGGYPGQSSSYGQPGGQQGGNEDSLKPFGDPKNGGPSPSALGAQPGRPGSAANTPAQTGPGGLPPSQHQQGFGGGYPGQHGGGQGGQYGGGLGGLGHQGAGSHQQTGNYGGGGGAYGSFGGGGGGYGSYSRGGWGTNYGQH